MPPFPLNLTDLLGHWGAYVVFFFIGLSFGAVLEMAGFGKSTKLAAQFYLKEMTVLKVMFTGIIVAMVLIFAASGLGLLDYQLLWVNPTYLWPGIVGGLLMGVGFIIGGFCPGTSLVSAATLKLDGIMFALGVFFGIFIFGETVASFETFWNSSYEGRYTLMELFNVETGVIVVGVVLMALAAFAFAEFSEKTFGGMDQTKAPRWRFAAAGVVMMGSVGVLAVGQPTNADRWDAIADEKTAELENREVQIHPAELLALREDRKITTHVMDVRSESDFNLFHIQDSVHVPADEVLDIVSLLRLMEDNTVYVLVSNDETAATTVWKQLVAESLPNVYILEGGINNWLSLFTEPEWQAEHRLTDIGDDQLAYTFESAIGSRHEAADPSHDVYADMPYESKVELEAARGATGGGCG